MNIIRSIVACSLFGILAAACVSDTDATQQRGDVRGEGGDDDECKIEGAQIGQVGASVTVGDTTIVFESWVAKADSPGEYVGFTLSTGNVHYVVKAGTERFASSGATWSNPYGDEGPDAQGISNVDFCDPPPCDYDAGVPVPID